MSDALHPTTPAPSGKSSKPNKPRPDFPVTAHPTGQGCKKIRGRIYYFGPWNDRDGALAKHNAEKDDLHAGRTPRPDTSAATVVYACNSFRTAKKAKLDNGEIGERTWKECKERIDLIVSAFGKSRLLSDLRSDDFNALRAKSDRG